MKWVSNEQLCRRTTAFVTGLSSTIKSCKRESLGSRLRHTNEQIMNKYDGDNITQTETRPTSSSDLPNMLQHVKYQRTLETGIVLCFGAEQNVLEIRNMHAVNLCMAMRILESTTTPRDAPHFR